MSRRIERFRLKTAHVSRRSISRQLAPSLANHRHIDRLRLGASDIQLDQLDAAPPVAPPSVETVKKPPGDGLAMRARRTGIRSACTNLRKLVRSKENECRLLDSALVSLHQRLGDRRGGNAWRAMESTAKRPHVQPFLLYQRTRSSRGGSSYSRAGSGIRCPLAWIAKVSLKETSLPG